MVDKNRFIWHHNTKAKLKEDAQTAPACLFYTDRQDVTDFHLSDPQQNLIHPIKGVKGKSFFLTKLLLRDAQRGVSVIVPFPVIYSSFAVL